MSYHQDWASRNAYPAYSTPWSTPNLERTFAIAAIILLFGALGLSLFDSWPSTTKRLIWEGLLYLVPSRIVYVTECAMIYYGRIPEEGAKFRPEDFSNHQAKIEALQRIFRLNDSRFTTTFQRVRALSGVSTMLGGAKLLRPSGLGNWDNSCYQNSIIQGLASLPALASFVQQNIDSIGEDGEAPTHRALDDIMNKLNASTGQSGAMWTPSALKSMDSWQQQDAQEYFSKIMDAMEKEFSKSLRRTKSVAGFEAHAQSRPPRSRSAHVSNPLEGLQAQRVACKQCGYAEGLILSPFNCLTINLGRHYEYDLEELLDEHTALENIEGVECTKCTLLQVQAQLEHLLAKSTRPDGLEQSPGAMKIKVTVQARLDSIRKVFEDDAFSESGILKRCSISAKSQVSAVKSKQVAVARPPIDLAIHINRSIFDDFGNQRKNTASVRFPPRFDLSRWCLGTKSSHVGMEDFERWSMASTESMLPLSPEELLDGSAVYELRCVVTHYGRHENGHYVAYGKRLVIASEKASNNEKPDLVTDQWYCFNDEIVTAVSEHEVLSRGNVFMLFYEAVERPSCPKSPRMSSEEVSGGLTVEQGTKSTLADEAQEAGVVCPEMEEQPDEDIAEPKGKVSVAEKPEVKEAENLQETSEVKLVNCTDEQKGDPLPTTFGPTTESATRASGVAPVMRTSSASRTLSRDSRRKDSFAVSSHSMVSAV